MQDSYEIQEEKPLKPVDLTKTSIRFIMLAFICALCFGSYFAYESPTSLQPQIESDLSITALQFSAFYSIYSLPNTILPIFGGLFIDKFGLPTSVVLFSVLVFLGQTLFFIGITQPSFGIALAGRGVFGLGGENLSMAQNALTLLWFHDKEQAMAIGLGISVSRLGSILCNSLEPLLYNVSNLKITMLLGLLICCISLLSAAFIWSLESRREKTIGIRREQQEHVNWRRFTALSRMYWITIPICICNYASILSFMVISSDYLRSRFKYSSIEAGLILNIPYVVSVILCPVSGHLADKHGKRGLLLVFSSALIAVAHVILMLTPEMNTFIIPVTALIILGVGYSVFTTIYWTSISFIVPSDILGSSIGVATCFSNLGLTIFPLVTGYLRDNTEPSHGYLWVSVTLIGLALVGFLFSLYLYFEDMNGSQVLDKRNEIEEMSTENSLENNNMLAYY